MRLHRFYIKEKITHKKEVKVSDESILHQMKSVFRLEAGNRVALFDGSGKDFECEVVILSKKEGVFSVKEERSAFVPEKKVTLYLAIIKKDNFELASRMATEIGVSKIVPILTERSEKKNIDIERLERIVKEASEQCGRGDIPVMAEITNFQDSIFNKDTEIFVADFGGKPISSYKPSATSAKLLFIGPEGGWSESERELFRAHNAKFISLGDTVLRAETAVVVASSVLLG